MTETQLSWHTQKVEGIVPCSWKLKGHSWLQHANMKGSDGVIKNIFFSPSLGFACLYLGFILGQALYAHVVAKMANGSSSLDHPHDESLYEGKELCLFPSCFQKRFTEDCWRSRVLPTPDTATRKHQLHRGTHAGFPRGEMFFATKGVGKEQCAQDITKAAVTPSLTKSLLIKPPMLKQERKRDSCCS